MASYDCLTLDKKMHFLPLFSAVSVDISATLRYNVLCMFLRKNRLLRTDEAISEVFFEW